jgi:hypothetical protein
MVRMAAFLLAVSLHGGVVSQDMATQPQLDSAYSVAVAPTPTASPLPAPNADLSLDQTTGGLSQVSGDNWETTVLLVDKASSACRGNVSFQLETSPPDRQITWRATSASYSSSLGGGSACEESVVFYMPQVPTAASLLFTPQGGTPTEIPLTLSRHVTVFQYLGEPAIAGAVLALLLALVALLLFSRAKFFSSAFWRAQSTALTISNTWSANVSTIFAVVGVILTVSTAEAAFFPGVATDRFVVVFVIAAIIAITAPLVFRLLYIRSARLSPRNLSLAGGASVTLPARDSPAVIEMACGGSILFPAGAMAHREERESLPVKPAARVLIPPGCTVEVHGTTMVFPGSTSDVAVHADSDFTISGVTGRFSIPRGDLAVRLGPRGSAGTSATKIETHTGAVISAIGSVGVTLPEHARIAAADRPPACLKQPTPFQVPDSGEVTATLGLVLTQAMVAMFGVGAMLGVISVLAFSLSVFDQSGRILAVVIMAAFGLLALYYSLTVIRSQFPAAT